jgi:hypothetical protein
MEWISILSMRIKFLDGPLIGLETDLKRRISKYFLWYEEDEEDRQIYCYCYEIVPGCEDERLGRILKRVHAPRWTLTDEQLYEILE